MKLTPSVLGSALLNALIWDTYSDMLIDPQSLINTTRSAANTITTAYINKTARIRANALFMHIEKGIFNPLTLLSVGNVLVRAEERSLTFAHWRSAAESERARLSAVLMSWGEAAAKQDKTRLARSRAELTHPTGPYSRKHPCKRWRAGYF